MVSRRSFILNASAGAAAFALMGLRPSHPWAADGTSPDQLDGAFARIEAETGGRLGVAVLDPATGLKAARRGDERFPMCSTFKLLAVAALLRRVDEGKEMLSRKVEVPQDAILSYAPIAKKHAGGTMTVSELCAATMVWSDNTTANLILEALGGPAAATEFVRSIGDPVTRIDRMEPDANVFEPGEVRDTTTPDAMLGNLDRLILGDVLSPLSRDRLTEWFVGCQVGQNRLRAGMPKTWRVGDRTGTGPHGTSNDIAVAWRGNGEPVLVTAYLTGSSGDGKQREAALADVGRAVADAVG